jgi:PIN domain nuclease of toxin-antitoxin system
MEIAVKASLGRLSVSPDVIYKAIEEAGISRLAISDAHLEELGKLPWTHQEPFARMLVAQSIAEPMKLLTIDWRLAAYGGPILLL